MLPCSDPARSVRASLLALADQLVAGPVAVVAASAGSGKSTLLAAWQARLADRGDPCASLTLDPIHRDASLLLADLIAVIRPLRPGFGAECERALAHLPGREDDWRLLARAFLRDRAADPHLLLIFLDGFHELISDSTGARLVDAFVRTAAPNLHWVIASRGALPDAVVRLRANGGVVEVDRDQLSLRSDEIQSVLATNGLEAGPELTAALLARTGGWAMGVRIAARRIAALQPDMREAYLEKLGHEPDLFGFIATEVLRDEPDALCAAVEAIALVGQCTAGDVARITGDPGAAGWIRRAIDRGILIPDGDGVGIQPLWRELLLERARERRSDDEHRALLRRAGTLLLESGNPDAALEALASAEEWTEIAAILGERGPKWLQSGGGERVRRWLARLPTSFSSDSPALLALQGLVALRTTPQAALPLLERAADHYARSGDRARERRLAGLVGLLHMTELRREDAIRALRRVISLRGLVREPTERANLLVLLAGRRLLTGRFAASLALSQRAATLPLEPSMHFLNAMNLALLRGVRGEWPAAQTALDQALARPELDVLPFSHWPLRVLKAQVLARSGALLDARQELVRVEEALADYAVPWLHELAAQEAGFVASRLGDRDEARRLFETAAARATGTPSEPMVRTLCAIERIAWGEFDEAAREARRALERSHERGAPLLVVAPWWVCFALWALGRAGAADEAWRLAQRWRRHFDQPGLRLAQHAMQLALADLALHAGDAEQARARACEAVAFAEREGLREPDPWIGALAGPAVAELALRAGASPDAACRLLAATAPARVAPLLGELAADPDPAVRARAVTLLARRGGRAAFEPLRAASRDAEPRVREVARAALDGLDLRPDFALEIRSFGGLSVLRGGTVVGSDSWKGLTARRLFARLLVAEGGPVRREQLLEDLWPGTEFGAARNNLRVATARLHDALDPGRPAGAPPHFVIADDQTLRLHPDAVERWDVTTFRSRLHEAADAERAGDISGALECERAALALYAGPLLDGIDADWAEPLRRALAQRFAAAGHRVGPRLVRRGRLDDALALAEHLLRADPADEQAYALRMRAQLAAHDRAGALRSFEDAAAALRRELDLEPGDELCGLVAGVRGAPG
jgi:LuxR family maltose regulon positive regulatory protein